MNLCENYDVFIVNLQVKACGNLPGGFGTAYGHTLRRGIPIITTSTRQRVKRRYKHIMIRSLGAAAIPAMLLLASCNSKENAEEDYVPAESVALTGFSLNPDARVMTGLDSVYFAIDLNRGIVYNPDSLPKGTFIGKLMPKISYPSTVANATFTMQGGSHRADAVTDYISNPNDTIDFTGNVTLTLSNADGTLSKSYTVKVNVHKENPDSLVWDKVYDAGIPSRLGNPTAQKTVALGASGAMTLTQENNGTYTLSEYSDLFVGHPVSTPLSLGFMPQVESFSACRGKYYILSDQGTLHESADGHTWTALPTQWTHILGEYSGFLLGIRDAAGERTLTTWPESAMEESPLPDGFPAEGFSNMLVYKSSWSPLPYALICGGRMADGSLTNAAWTFDGHRWINLAERPMPSLYRPVIISYHTFRTISQGAEATEFDTLMAIGGIDNAGTANREIYLSYDNGITWVKASGALVMPDFVNATAGADALVVATPRKMPVSDYWKESAQTAPRRVHNYSVSDGYVKWECPYIFIFGGQLADGTLNNAVYKTLLARLSFVPIF